MAQFDVESQNLLLGRWVNEANSYEVYKNFGKTYDFVSPWYATKRLKGEDLQFKVNVNP